MGRHKKGRRNKDITPNIPQVSEHAQQLGKRLLSGPFGAQGEAPGPEQAPHN